jgi:tetratricopeptide (TPR) repeat protein/tRNA A-37 threonylcarbamoyl transferase component Bud32
MKDTPHPGPGLPAAQALRVEEACVRFEAAWQAGGRPRLEDYLGPAEGPEHRALLRELVALDVHYRRRAGEPPQPADYRDRFPGLDPEACASAFEGEAAGGAATPVPAPPEGADTVRQDGLPGQPPTPPAPFAGIGDYEVVGELGRGGMGVVYKARQVSLNRLVALKMVLAGEHARPEDLARFLAEGQVVARLQHPHVVQIYEVGEHAGRPFFALEYLEGGSLQDKLRGAPLPAREAAQLAEVLARAMQAAHARGVIHRDLKPANVLLDQDGRPKITDFGLAKRVEGGGGLTQSGAILGTPSYMAPEQAAGQGKAVGPAADVYALGAVLYECLTGRPPFKAATALDTLLQVLREEPVSPRRLQPPVPPDLETICLTCLRKEPARRYASALALADDLKRFLSGEPIRARPSTLWEKARKWTRRKPAAAALIAVSGLALLTLFGVVLGFTVQLRAALQATRDERDRAEGREKEANRERAVAQAVNAFLQDDLLGQADVGNQPLPAGKARRDRNVTVRELLDRSAAGVEGKFADQPEVKAAIRLTIGDAYRALGEYDKAHEQLDRAVAWRRQHLGADHPDTLSGLNNLATLYRSWGRYAEAEPLFQEVLACRRRQLGADHPHTLHSLNNLASLYWSRGRYAEAEPLLQEALAGYRRLGPDHPDTLSGLNNLANLYRSRGHLDKAEPLLKEALAGLRRKLGADHPDTLTGLNNLALLYRDRGRYAEAEPPFKEALAGRRRMLGADHPDTLRCLNNLALLYLARGDFDKAEPPFKEALAGRRSRLGADHPDTLNSLESLGVLYRSRGRYAEAEPLLREALAGQRGKLGADHPDTLRCLDNLANLYQDCRRYAEAEALFQEALAGRRRRLGADHPDTLSSLNNLAVLYGSRGHLDKAEPLLKEALAGQRRKLGADHPETLTSLNNLALLYRDRGRYAEAEPLSREALVGYRRTLGADHPNTLNGLNTLASLYWSRGRYAEAEPLFREALAGQRRKLGADHPDTLRSLDNLANLYQSRGRYAEAEPLLLEAVSGARRKLGPAHPTTQALILSTAVLYERGGQPAKAEPLWRELAEAAKKQAGPGAPSYAARLANLGTNLLKQRKPAEAEPPLRTCLAIRQGTQPDAWSTFNARSLLGEALARQKRYAEAEPLLLAGHEGLEARARTVPPQAQHSLTEALERLVQLYDAWGKPEQAAAWRQKLEQARTPQKGPKK